MTHFQITGISNGTLFQNDGGPRSANGGVITVAQAAAGLRFTPAANFVGNGTFNVRAQTDAAGAGASATVAATITVTAVNDMPTISDIANQSVAEDTATAALAFTIGDVETAAGSLTVIMP